MSQTAVEPRTSGTGRWLAQRRLKIALGVAVLEGILVAIAKDFSAWTVIIVSAPIIAFYLFAGRALESDTGRQFSWIAAASQTFAVILCIVFLVIDALMLIVAGVFAVVALILILGERSNRT